MSIIQIVHHSMFSVSCNIVVLVGTKMSIVRRHIKANARFDNGNHGCPVKECISIGRSGRRSREAPNNSPFHRYVFDGKRNEGEMNRFRYSSDNSTKELLETTTPPRTQTGKVCDSCGIDSFNISEQSGCKSSSW